MKRPLLFVLIACAIALPAGVVAQERPPTSFKDAPFAPVPKGELLAPPRIDYGRGDCAPVFPDGSRGSCINDRPCNGFGFREADGKLVCRCFDNPSCTEGFTCSLRSRACVRLRTDGIVPVN